MIAAVLMSHLETPDFFNSLFYLIEQSITDWAMLSSNGRGYWLDWSPDALVKRQHAWTVYIIDPVINQMNRKRIQKNRTRTTTIQFIQFKINWKEFQLRYSNTMC